MMRRRVIEKILVILMLSVPLAACGVKPGFVDPPEGAEDAVYPQTYPTSIEK